MMGGVTDRVRDIVEFVKLVEAAESKPGKRGSCKKKVV